MEIRVLDYIIAFAGFLATWVLKSVGASHAKLRSEHDALRDAHNEARVAFGRLEAQLAYTRETLQEVLSSVRRLESRP